MEKGTHGPWPVSDGLPTIEEHRNMSVGAQLKHCLSLKNVDEVIIGNAYASEAECHEIADVMKHAFVNTELDPAMVALSASSPIGDMSAFLPKGDVMRIPFKVKLDEGVTEVEKKAMMDYPLHNDMGDCLNYTVRSRFTRFFFKNESIPVRPCEKTHYTRGDVVIVNDNCKHYAAEIQIVLKDMEVDGQRNLLGRIVDDELVVLNHIGAGDLFTFIE